MSISIEQCSRDQWAQWDSFLEMMPYSTYSHRIEWQRAVESTYNLKVLRLVAKDGEKWVGILPFVVMPRLLGGKAKAVSLPYCNYGGLLAVQGVDAEPLKVAAIKYLTNMGIGKIEFRDLAPALPDTSEVTMVLILPESSDKLWEQLSSGVRNKVRKAQRGGFTLRWGRDQGNDLYTLYAKNMGRLGTPVHSPKFFKAILSNLGERADVLTVRHEDQAIGSMLVIKHGATWIDMISSCLTEFNSLKPNMLMYWEAQRAACDGGAKLFDFGRSQKDSGTYHFKKQWGAKEIALNYYSYRNGALLPSSSISFYRGQSASKLANIWRQLPSCVQGRLGPVIRRWLP